MEQYANDADTLLNGSINNSVTSITVDDGSVFPSSGDFRLLIDTEILLCTARSGNTLTVTRGVESTTAASHADDTPVTHLLTKASFLKLLEEGHQVGARASRPSTAHPGTTYTPTDYGLVSRYNGSAWEYINYGRVVNPPVVSNFTWVNQGTATAVDRDGILLELPDATANVRSLVQSTPGSTYTCTMGFDLRITTQAYFGVGIVIRESSTSKLITAFIRTETAGNHSLVFQADKWTNNTTFSAAYAASAGRVQAVTNRIYLKVQRTGSNRIYSMSVNGYDWFKVTTDTTHTDHISSEDQIGVGGFTFSSAQSYSGAQAHIFDFSLS